MYQAQAIITPPNKELVALIQDFNPRKRFTCGFRKVRRDFDFDMERFGIDMLPFNRSHILHKLYGYIHKMNHESLNRSLPIQLRLKRID